MTGPGGRYTAAKLLFAYNSGERDFEGWRLEGADLSALDLAGINLKRANLRGADLHRTRLIDASLEEACLAGVNLSEATLDRARLKGADLRGADLHGVFHADVRDAKLEGAYLSWYDLPWVRISDGDLKRVWLSDIRRPTKGNARTEPAHRETAEVQPAPCWNCGCVVESIIGTCVRCGRPLCSYCNPQARRVIPFDPSVGWVPNAFEYFCVQCEAQLLDDMLTDE